jgi:hypothetical protein
MTEFSALQPLTTIWLDGRAGDRPGPKRALAETSCGLVV